MTTRKSYFLGVDSIDTAFNAIDTLSFCTVLDRARAEIEIVNIDRIKVFVTPANDSEGAIIIVTGAFTLEEMREIETLAPYEHEPLRQEVAQLVAKTAVTLQGRGFSTEYHILGKPE